MPAIASAPSAAAWNSAPDPADRPVGLGRQEDGQQSGLRVIEPWVSRRPTVTATIATEIDASSSSAAELA